MHRRQAGIEDPRERTSMAEVHDCFTPTELVPIEDVGFSPRGQACRDTMDGRFDLDGDQPVNPDGGPKTFGHPIGASGLRMMYEMWLQLCGEAGERQIADPKLGLTHNLGGAPGRCVSIVSVVGLWAPTEALDINVDRSDRQRGRRRHGVKSSISSARMSLVVADTQTGPVYRAQRHCRSGSMSGGAGLGDRNGSWPARASKNALSVSASAAEMPRHTHRNRRPTWFSPAAAVCS